MEVNCNGVTLQGKAIMPVKSIPDGYHSVTPYLIVTGAVQALDFYRRAFGAEETLRMPAPNDRIGHAEIRIGDSVVMLADEFPEIGAKSPQTLGGAGVHLMIYVDDADVIFNRAIAAGAKATRPIQDQFYGDRTGTLVDPFGHQWTIATHIEDVSNEEMQRRMDEAMKQQ